MKPNKRFPDLNPTYILEIMGCGSGFRAAIFIPGMESFRGWKAAPTPEIKLNINSLLPVFEGGNL
ncbi:MAG: hypothetical protein IMF02_08435 [Proteobacteria bacterium]|nr:hypothetical protein [Pseudomonadota bacterium]